MCVIQPTTSLHTDYTQPTTSPTQPTHPLHNLTYSTLPIYKYNIYEMLNWTSVEFYIVNSPYTSYVYSSNVTICRPYTNLATCKLCVSWYVDVLWLISLNIYIYIYNMYIVTYCIMLCVFMYACASIYVLLHTRTYIHTCTYTRLHTHAHIHTRTYTRIRTHTLCISDISIYGSFLFLCCMIIF